MLNALFLQIWYGLSGVVLEKQVTEGLLFRGFLNLNISESESNRSSF